MLFIDPTAWPGDDMHDAARSFDALILWALLISAVLVIGGLGFIAGRLTA